MPIESHFDLYQEGDLTTLLDLLVELHSPRNRDLKRFIYDTTRGSL